MFPWVFNYFETDHFTTRRFCVKGFFFFLPVNSQVFITVQPRLFFICLIYILNPTYQKVGHSYEKWHICCLSVLNNPLNISFFGLSFKPGFCFSSWTFRASFVGPLKQHKLNIFSAAKPTLCIWNRMYWHLQYICCMNRRPPVKHGMLVSLLYRYEKKKTI